MNDIYYPGMEVEVLQPEGIWIAATIVDIRRKTATEDTAYCLQYRGFRGENADSGGDEKAATPWIEVRDIKGLRHALPQASGADADDMTAVGIEMPKDQMDLQALKKTVSGIPSVADMSQWAVRGGSSLLRQELDKIDVLIYPLLRWLVTTNKAHLRRLREDEQFSSLGSPHQFVLMSGPVEREQEFQSLKRANGGSLFLWHGSDAGNWHVILRTSLKNMSGTKHMSAGAAVRSKTPPLLYLL